MTGMGMASVPAPARILVVDDDDAGRYAKCRILRRAGFEVVEAASGREALDAVERDAPDLILMDVRLPDVSGIEVCRQIKADPANAALPVVQVSASFRDDQSKTAGLVSGADAYLTEPIEPGLLLATIGVFLRMRRAEQQLRERAAEWEATFEAITDGIALLDAEGRIRRFNPALPAVLERPAPEITGALLDDLLPPDAQEPPLSAALDSGERQDAERSAAGRSFAVSVDPVRDADGRRCGAVLIVRDVTQAKLLYERLRDAQKLESVGVLAGGVAHDFNNLLMGVLGNASLGLEMLHDPAALQHVLKDIVRASERAADLTRQLLAYAGKGHFVSELLDLSAIVSGIVPLVEASFLRKVRLVLDLPRGLPAVKADRVQIDQVVMNLVINAAEATADEGGVVSATTGSVHFEEDRRDDYIADGPVRGDYVRLRVQDNGVGIPADTLGRIFDPFFTTKFMGRGLGLSAVLGIIRAHKGALRVTSAPGQGTTFELLFPSVAPAHREAPVADPGRPARRKRRGKVLVIDDEQMVRDFFCGALGANGYEVLAAGGGVEGLDIFRKQAESISTVLLDIVMPGMSGREVLPKLFEIRGDARVVVTSGQMEDFVRRELNDARIAGFIQKPITVDALIRKFDSLGSARRRSKKARKAG